MSECMTIADETVDQKDTCTEIAPKRIVEFILEEALLSAFIILDKGCSRIGDSNITDDFRSQYDQLSCQKDFEQVDHSENQSAANQESNLNSGGNIDCPASWLTARGNLESIIDSLVKNEEKIKPGGECKIITEEILADNELQIQNGQIHLETNRSEKTIPDPERQDYFEKEDFKDEKIEIEFYNEERLSKIYVPFNPSSSSNCAIGPEQKEETSQDEPKGEEVEDIERPFEPITTEEVRQVWENGVSSFVGKWDGDVLAEQDEVVRLMDGLSSVQMFPDSFTDPNRPRACAFAEEDVKKMIKEIEEISLTQSHAVVKDFDVAFLPDGQGDADSESKSLTKSMEFLEKTQKTEKPQDEPESKSSDEPLNDQQQDQSSSPEESSSENISETSIESKDNETSTSTYVKLPTDNIKGEQHLRYKVIEEESLLKSRLYDETAIREISTDQIIDTGFSIDLPPENDTENSAPDSNALSKEESEQNMSEVFLMDSVHLKGFQNERNLFNEFLPESVSLSGNMGSLSESKQEELTLRHSELASESDLMPVCEKESDKMKESSNSNEEIIPDLTPKAEQGTSSSEKLNCLTTETESRLNLDSFSKEKYLRIPSMESFVKTEEKTESNDADDFLQEPESRPDKPESRPDVRLEIGHDSERLEEDLSSSEKMTENFENMEERIKDAVNESFKVEAEGKTALSDDAKSIFIPNPTSAHESVKSLNSEESNNTETEQKPSVTSSQTPSVSAHSSTENEFSESSDAPEPGTEKFKLHSPKMYLGANYQPAGSTPNEYTLTESEEAFIDLAESVIQIIDPPQDSADEESSKISFSLLSEAPNQKSPHSDHQTKSECSLEKNVTRETEVPAKKVYSGMTTIGPMKNIDYDPRDLTAPEIDYGKMTRITSSRQLAKDMSLLSAEVTTTMSVKIIEEDDSDDSVSLNNQEDRLDRTSLVNRDIASLTKVQKVREVMSYQPKPEEDFEDEEVLPRPRLDLKDVESMTDERYKVPDVSLPLLSFEIADGSLEAGKELIESMGLVISGLTNPAYYEEDVEEDTMEISVNSSARDTESVLPDIPSDVKLVDTKSSKLLTKDTESKSKEEIKQIEVQPADDTQQESLRTTASDSQHECPSTHTKYSTLGSVFRKASSKFIRKDEDLFMRNSKSLPRDTSKISATDSIRSIIDDCQSSASNMLKKSRSLLKNTQSLFKSMSQSRVVPDRISGQSVDQKKLSPSESDVSAMERKFSGFLKREDFTKARNLFKSKVEKTFKHDMEGSTAREPEISPERKKNLQVVVRNEQNLRVDRIENFKKLLPKSPLVYKSQFHKSQMNFQTHEPEPQETSFDSAESSVNQQESTVNQQELTVNQKESSVYQEESAVDRKESSVYQEKFAVSRKESSVYQEELAVDRKESAINQQELVIDRKESSVYQEELTVDRKESLVYQEELTVDRKESSVYQEELAVDRKESAIYQQELAVDRKESLVYQEELAVDRKESLVYQEELAVDRKESLAYQEELTVDRKESSVYQEELTVDRKESAIYQQELEVDRKESSVYQEKFAVDQKKSLVYQQKLAVDRKESAIYQEELAVDRKESSVYQEELAVDQKKSSMYQEKFAVSRKESAIYQEELAVDRKDSPVYQEELAVDRKESSVYQEELAVDRKESAIYQQELEVDQKKSLVYQQELAVDRKESAIYQEELAVGRKESLVYQQELAVDRKESAIYQEELAVDRKESAIYQQELEVDRKESSVYQEELAVDRKESSVYQEELAVDRKESSVYQEKFAVSRKESAIYQEELAVDRKDSPVYQEELAVDRKESAIDQQEFAVNRKESAIYQQELEVDRKESSVYQEELAVDRKESSVYQEELAVDRKESSVYQEELAVDRKESSVYQEKFAVSRKESAIYQQELAVDRKESLVYQEELAVDRKESPIDQQELAVGRKESLVYQEELAVDRKESAIDQQELAVGRKESLVYQEELAVNRKESAIDQQELAVDRKESAIYQQELEVDRKESLVYQEELAVDRKESAIDQQELAVDRKKSAIDQQESTVDRKESAIDQQEFAVNRKESAIYQQELEVDRKESSVYHEKFAVSRKESAIYQEELAVDRKESEIYQQKLAVDQKNSEINQHESTEVVNVSAVQDSSDTIPESQTQAILQEVCLEEKLQWVNSKEEFHSTTNLEELEPQQPRYIVMETIQGLPTSDLESPSSEKENLNMEFTGNVQAEKAGNDSKKVEASNSVQIFTDGGHDVAPCFPEIDEDKMATKTPSDRKIKAKKKKFTARFRSFWCSAFGRVKTSPKKGDLS